MNKYYSHIRIGHRAEKRVGDILSKRGICEFVYTHKGSPDLLFKPRNDEGYLTGAIYGIEVKSVQGISGGKIGRIRINKIPWKKLLEWCEENSARNWLIVEIRGGRKPTYFKIWGYKITELMKKSKAGSVSLTVWQIINLGEKLESCI